MSNWRYILKSLLFHRRINLAVALGVAAATAVLTGALIVGDSMRGSLRDLTLDRLGKIDEFLISDLFFREELAEELAGREEFQEHYSRAVGAIYLMSTTAEKVAGAEVDSEAAGDESSGFKRASGVTIIGCHQDFWKLGDQSLADVPELKSSEIMINRQLADELGIGDEELTGDSPALVTLRIAEQQTVSADSPIGAKGGNTENIPRLKVVRILPNESVARFAMQPSQMMPPNAFVSLELLQEILEQPEKVNAIFVAGKSPANPPDESASRQLRDALHPTLEDAGLLLRTATQKYSDDGEEKTAFEYQSLSSSRMMIRPETEKILESVLVANKPQPVLTYLANRIDRKRVEKEVDDQADNETQEQPFIPFSMVTAIEFGVDFQLESSTGGAINSLADDEIVLNSWAADILGVQVDDIIPVTFYEPETSHGENVERVVQFRLKAIAALTEPDESYRLDRPAIYTNRPTLANDPELTPYVPGVTDRDSIENWNLPFDTPGIDSKDDRYWQKYRTTPKAFITLNKGRELWRSRFGQTTSFRLVAGSLEPQELAREINQEASASGESLGLSFMPLKRNGLQASSGSTPFDALFLSLSFFIIASAIMLVALLFRLGIEQRANEIGVLTATGIDRRKATRLMIAEGMLVSVAGGLIGLLIGIGYAWLMLTGLTTIWVEAIVTPFLKLHISPVSLLIGLVSGIVICAITISLTMLRTRLHSIRSLLAGELEQPKLSSEKRSSKLTAIFAGVCLLSAIGLSIAAIWLPGGEAQAGAFVGSGFMLLTGILIIVWRMLRSGGNRAGTDGQLSLPGTAIRNAGRKPGRSALTIGLVAIATFLIAAISSFHLSPTEEGTGGFQWVAQSDQPLHFDLNDIAERKRLFGDQAAQWRLGETLAMRLKPGADASCNNPYQISQPRVLGITAEDIAEFGRQSTTGFAWAGSLAKSDSQRENPWQLLEENLDDPDRIPVVIDKNTAMYSLKIFSVGQDFELTYDENQTIKFRVVGFLANSILQGSLLVSEENFKRLFPEISGYRYFLVRQRDEQSLLEGESQLEQPQSEIQTTGQIESGLREYGFDLRNARKILESLLAVQNTYLKAFQSLGSLGLLLGTFGLATVQLRNVFERRKELAVLSAVGFSHSRLASLVLLEHVLLLLGGLLIGIIAAFFAVLPHAWFGNAEVPWMQLLVLLGTITVVGLLTGIFAVRSSLKVPVLAALRGE